MIEVPIKELNQIAHFSTFLSVCVCVLPVKLKSTFLYIYFFFKGVRSFHVSTKKKKESDHPFIVLF